MNTDPKTHACKTCGKRFASDKSMQQHGRAAHSKVRKIAIPFANMGHQDVYDLVESMDLPDGAHWAMIEELSGLEPSDFLP